MPRSEDSRSRSAHVMAPHRWRSARILEAVYEVNEHLVSVLIELARLGSVSNVVVTQNADALRHLDVAACKRVARMPVLLLDLHFQGEDWWRNATRANGEYRASTIGPSALPANYAAELTRESLVVAWLAVQHARQGASLLFGMSDSVAGLLGELTPAQISRLADRSSHELRIRWQMKPDFWRQLLAAGQCANTVDLCEVHLLGLQLLGGELMSLR
jgi:hypothetical protein